MLSTEQIGSSPTELRRLPPWTITGSGGLRRGEPAV